MIGAGGQGRLTDLRDYTVRARLFSSKSTLFNLPPRALLSTTTTTMTSSREERFQTQESPSNPGRSKAYFSYRADEWVAQVRASRAVAYDVVFGANARVYLDASFTRVSPPVVPTLAMLLADGGLRVLGIDLNHGFIAPAVLDRSGNPLRRFGPPWV